MRVNQATQDWASGDVENHGLLLSSVAGESTSFKRFATVEEAGDDEAYLRVNWREPLLGTLGYYTLNSEQINDRTKFHVNPANGNLVVESADVNLAGVGGTNLGIGQFYNSREDTDHPNRTGQTGTGWTTTVGPDVRLSQNDAAGSAFLEGPSGYALYFPFDQSTGEYDKPDELNATLTDNTPGDTTDLDFTVEFIDSGLKYNFEDDPALASMEDQYGRTIDVSYTSATKDKVTTLEDTHGDDTTYEYFSGTELLKKITDPRGRTVQYAYTGTDLTSITDQNNTVTTFGYDGDHNMTSITDPRGKTTSFAYDGDDRVTDITWADNTAAKPAVTSYDYSNYPTVVLSDQRNKDYEYTFDDNGRISEYLSPRATSPESYAYNDAFNTVKDYTNNTGGIGTLAYDGYNVQSVTSDSGAKSEFAYNDPQEEDKPSQFTDSRGVAISYDWNDKDQLNSVENEGDSSISTMTYRTSGESCTGLMDTSTDGESNTTTYDYDSRCNLEKVTRPGPAGNTTMTYDTNDRVKTITDGVGNKQTVTYDNRDRVTKVEYRLPGQSAVSSKVLYTYDANGNQLTRADTHGGSTKNSTYALDARNRVTSEALPQVTNTYAYDVAGNMASHTGPGGTTTYGYDKENDVSSMQPPVGGEVKFRYTEHTTSWIAFPNNTKDKQHYDKDGRIEQIQHYKYTSGSGFTSYADLNYDYQIPGTSTNTDSVYEITDPDYDTLTEYTYDDNGRVTSSHGEDTTTNDVFEDTSYTYDDNSNITAWDNTAGDSFTASYNASDQMTSMVRPSGTWNYTYDNNGNTLTSTGGDDFAYDVRNRAEDVEHHDSTAGGQAQEYNGTGQFERTKAGGTTFTPSLLGVTSSKTGAQTTYYLRAPDGRVVGQREPNGDTYYYLSDRLGSITGVTNPTGDRINSYGYDPYGEYTYGEQSGPYPTYKPHVPFRYTGAWLDGTDVTGDGFYKIGLRFYDTNTNRWTQTDPLDRAINPAQPAEAQPYNYAGCNPTNQTDPTGAYSWSEFGNAALSATAGAAGAVVGAGFGFAVGGPAGAAVGAYGGGTCFSGAASEGLNNPGAGAGDVAAACGANVLFGWAP